MSTDPPDDRPPRRSRVYRVRLEDLPPGRPAGHVHWRRMPRPSHSFQAPWLPAIMGVTINSLALTLGLWHWQWDGNPVWLGVSATGAACAILLLRNI